MHVYWQNKMYTCCCSSSGSGSGGVVTIRSAAVLDIFYMLCISDVWYAERSVGHSSNSWQLFMMRWFESERPPSSPTSAKLQPGAERCRPGETWRAISRPWWGRCRHSYATHQNQPVADSFSIMPADADSGRSLAEARAGLRPPPLWRQQQHLE